MKLDPSGRSLEIRCDACVAVNRVPLGRLGEGPVCGRCGECLAADQPLETSVSTFDAMVREAQVPVLVDFWAPWCGPCRSVGPELEKLAVQKQGRLLVAKLNSDENPQIAARLSVRAIPTLLLFRKGHEDRRLQGAMRAHEIVAQLGL